MPEGLDYAFGRPSIAALKAAGVKFVCRYLSHSPTKNLTSTEAHALSNAGIWIVVVWETTAKRASTGHAAGIDDAMDAQVQALACGMPADRPIYFAVDWDASSSQQAAINAYLDGAASVLGRDRVGVYGGYGPVRRALNKKVVTFAWQTYAWSGGQWDSRAQLQQYSNDHTIGGVGCDYNRAKASDYGQWRIGVSPAPQPQQQEETDMPQRELKDGLDTKTGMGLPPKTGGYTYVEAFTDNTYTDGDGGKVKAFDPVTLRVAVRKSDGTWQSDKTFVVGRGPKDTKQPQQRIKLDDKNSTAVSVTRVTGAGDEPIVIFAY